MPQIINTNIASLNAQRNLDRTQGEGDTALERLSSGLRINSAADDAAGLAISTRFESQTQGLDVGIRNANDGVSLSQTAEGALGSMTDNLQRIRELSLQSANATNSAQDRASLNEEVQELKAEIKRVSEQTNFNGTKLLDGSFEKSTFQIGANRGETVDVNIAGTTPDKLGAAATDGITASPSPAALDEGDLEINGIAIPATQPQEGDPSKENVRASAIAKAAAVNEKAEESGVKAIVNETSVAGSALTAEQLPQGGGTIEINETPIELRSGDNTNPVQFMEDVAASINSETGQTDVRAEFDGEPSRGITLVSEEGGNITIDTSSLTGLSDQSGTIADDNVAAAFGLPDTGDSQKATFTGNYTLISEDGSDINLDTSSGNIENAGFQTGTFSGNNSGAVSTEVGATEMDSGDIVINDVPIGGSVESADNSSPSTSNRKTSAIAKAAAINESSSATGVTAEVNSSIYTANETLEGTDDTTFEINNIPVSVDFSGTSTAAEKAETMVTQINKVSGDTKVKAETFGDSYRLIADDGRNIEISNFDDDNGNIAPEDFGFPDPTGPDNVTATPDADNEDTLIKRGSISLESAGKIEIESLTANNESSGFQVGTYGSNENGALLQDVDISTVKGANDAIVSMDNALDQVNRQRANLGSIQNRFESTIENQQVASENLTAANSRIRDADFAEESAELARTQTLQQAGISILSQANQRPQQVLQLLQG